MIYRTSQRGTYRNITSNLDLLSYRIGQLSNKIASEKAINKPSDNPSGASTVLRTRSVLAEISQYTDNVNYSTNWLTNTGNVMDSIKGTLDEIYTKAEQGATDTYTADQRKIIATEIDELFQTLIQFGDSKFGNNYLLAGMSVGTQPFSLDQRAQQVLAACDNSSLWTGKVQNYSQSYQSRPDLPVQSQKFLVEVVQAGGIDSRLYANQSSLSSLKLPGQNASGDFVLDIQSKDQKYNQTQVRLVAGPENNNLLGSTSSNVVISFAASSSVLSPIQTTYTYASSSSTVTWAAYDSTNNSITVYLQTSGGPPPHSIASAGAVMSAVNSLSAQTLVTASLSTGSSAGTIELARDSAGRPINSTISFNYGTFAEVNGNLVTVYLERDPNGTLIATADDVASAITNSPAGAMLSVSVTGSGASGLISPQTSYMSLVPSDPYTLAWAEVEVPGSHNDLVFSVLNEPGASKGQSGNNYSIQYVYGDPRNVTAPTSATISGTSIVVTLGTSAAVYLKEYARLMTDIYSPAYPDNPALADEMARQLACTATGLDVISAVTALNNRENLHIGVKLAEGNSGLGKMAPTTGAIQFSQGYDQAALFRVSQDGGLTWGPPQSFNPSEYPQNTLLYNSQLGHASLTTNLPGTANDLVFTANYMGTWGDDVKVEFKQPLQANQSASVTVGPQPWNICVNLATDSLGKITTTANDVVDLIKNHPEAGQLVTVSLANYHEGGGGLVTAMACQNLSTGEPYELDGRTRITPLGQATAAVAFPYSPSSQSSPDLIFQALEHGRSGNNIGIRYTTSADTAIYGSGATYQDHVSVGYEISAGVRIVVVHLATETLPSCPDAETDRAAYDQWQSLYPAYSCTSSRAVISTAGDVLEALVKKNLENPQSALVWASMDYLDEGWDSTAKVGATNGVVWLNGGNDQLKEEDYGISLRFIPDGTAMQVGDIFQVGVGWYNGDANNLDINVMNSYRTTMNITGDQLLGANGDSDNILDTVQRLSWALKHNDSELVGRELPKLKSAIEKVTTMETNVGTRIIRNQFVASNLELNKYSAESTLSQIEDADFTRLITELKNAQLVYEAVLGTTGLTTKLSLLNYI